MARKILSKWRMTLPFTDVGKSCTNRECLTSQTYLLTLFAKIKFSRKCLQYLDLVVPNTTCRNNLYCHIVELCLSWLFGVPVPVLHTCEFSIHFFTWCFDTCTNFHKCENLEPIFYKCENLVPILLICEKLVPILHIVLVLNTLKLMKTVKFEHNFAPLKLLKLTERKHIYKKWRIGTNSSHGVEFWSVEFAVQPDIYLCFFNFFLETQYWSNHQQSGWYQWQA